LAKDPESCKWLLARSPCHSDQSPCLQNLCWSDRVACQPPMSAYLAPNSRPAYRRFSDTRKKPIPW
jgi:hypothetical protein